MTEAEWLACADPQQMLAFIRGKTSDRKLRLFACACCRRIWPLLTDERSRKAVEAAEWFADGQITKPALNAAFAEAAGRGGWPETAAYAAAFAGLGQCSAAAGGASGAVKAAIASGGSKATENAGQADLLRCIFGNPFHPVALDPSWLAWNDCTIPELAQAICDQRAFDRLPVLADALEVAGCTNADILAHCRQPGPHVRGCWVLDLILGKE